MLNATEDSDFRVGLQNYLNANDMTVYKCSKIINWNFKEKSGEFRITDEDTEKRAEYERILHIAQVDMNIVILKFTEGNTTKNNEYKNGHFMKRLLVLTNQGI